MKHLPPWPLDTVSLETVEALQSETDAVVVGESPLHPGVLVWAAELGHPVTPWMPDSHCAKCGWLASHRAARVHASNGAPQPTSMPPVCSVCSPRTADAVVPRV